MKVFLFAVGLIALVVIASSAVTSATWIFWEAWKGSDREAFRALLGGFCGAFFAFVFVRIGEGLKRLYERQEKDHTSLVTAEHYLNDCLGVTGDNLFVVDDFLATVTEKRLNGPTAAIYLNEFKRYDIDRQLLLGLANIDYVNDLHSLNESLRKLNESLSTIDRAREQLTEAIIGQKIDLASYSENMRRTRNKCIEVRGFIEDAREDIVVALAKAQLQLKEAPFFVAVMRSLVRRNYSKAFLAKVPMEVARVKGDMEAIATASRNKIDETLKRAPPDGGEGR